MKTADSLSRFLLLIAAAAFALASQVGQCEEAPPPAPKSPQPVTFDIFRELPVWHHGRVMPLDTLAKVTGETVSGTGSSVNIQLEGYYTDKELASPQLQGALTMFPGGKARRVPVAEMLLSWQIEPDKWEDVPFILCEHEDLHKALGLKSKTDKGLHRKFVSPRQITQSEELVDFIIDFTDRQSSTLSANEEFEETDQEKMVRSLLDRYDIFRKLSLDPRLPLKHTRVSEAGGRDEFAIWFDTAMRVLMQPNETKQVSTVDSLRDFIQIQQTHGIKSEIADAAQSALFAFGQLQQLEDRMRPARTPAMGEEEGDEPEQTPLTLEEVEQAVVQARQAAIRLHEVLEGEKERVFDDEGVTQSQAETLRPMFDELAHKSEKLTDIGLQMHLALYDNGARFRGIQDHQSGEFRYGASLYVTPALNAAALKKERDDKNEAEPWLTLQTVLYGSDELLFGEAWPLQNYNRKDVKEVRAAWKELADAYTDRESDQRAQRVENAQVHLASALRVLGEGVETSRVKLIDEHLPKDQRDDALIAYTKYPSADRLSAELAYNRVKPFRWSWVICLFSVMAFGLAFGVIKRPAFWAGTALLMLVVLWTIFGFYLRVKVTGWAPVTNMYETIVFVPWVGAVLALWFLLLPVLWTGIKDAWRMSAIPGAWEATELDNRQRLMMGDATWNIFGALLCAARVGLMVWIFRQLAFVPYSDGNRTIFYLVPDVGAVNHSSISDLLNVYGVYVVNLGCLLFISWFIPRLLITALASLVTIPMSWFQQGNSFDDMVSRVYNRRVFGIAGAALACFLFMIAAFSPPAVADEDFRPLQPVLRSNFWLTIHVLTIVASYGAGLLAWIIGLIGLGYYLFGKYRNPVVAANVPKGMQPAGGGKDHLRLGRQPPEECATLANYAYRAVQVAVLLLASGTILGGLWADVSWGRFWGWDPKEIWALISTLVYLAILHGRFAGWFNNFGMIAGTILGALMITLSWYGVNFVLPLIAPDGAAGLHSYGSGEGGQGWVALFAVLNVVYLIAAGVRYRIETAAAYVPVEHTPDIPDVFQAKVSPGDAKPQGA